MKTRKDLHALFGEIKIVDGLKKFVPKSPKHMRAILSRLPLGNKIVVTFSADISTRSDSQLAYHWVLMGYIAEHTGHSKEEIHDAVMRIQFGTKRIKLGDKIVDVRQSVSDQALFPKSNMMELITKDLEICKELEIIVPSAEELGYISNSKPIK